MTGAGLIEAEQSGSATPIAKPIRISDGVAAVLALGLLVGSAGLIARGAPPVDRRPAAFRTVDFNDPGTLAWSLQQAGPEAESLREVKCSTDARPVFVCHGANPDGTEATVQVVVAIDGTSWTSR